MPSNKRPFGELFAEPTRNGLTRPKSVRGAGTKMVNMGELFAFPRLHNIPMDRVPLTNEEAEKSLLQAGDLLFARQSLVLEGAGKCSIFLGDDEPVTFESHVTRVRLDNKVADPQFYFYYFQSPHGRAAIRSIVEQGAGAAGIRGSDLKGLEVEWRDVEEQSEVSEILSTLDDKIELNRRMNETLEAIARAIFKSWFVDFDPVRAKASGEPPESICRRLRLTPELLALFPDRLVDSELGEIPEGWRVGKLGDLYSAKGGYAYKSRDFLAEGNPVVKIKNITGSGTVDLVDVQYIDDELAEKSNRFALGDGDVVMAMTGATVGKTGIIVTINNSIPYLNQRVAKFESNNKHEMPSWLVFCLFQLQSKFEELVGNASGSAQPNISSTGIESTSIVVANTDVLESFNETVDSLFNRWIINNKEISTLSIIRDALLRELLSGDLRVPVVEDEAEGIA